MTALKGFGEMLVESVLNAEADRVSKDLASEKWSDNVSKEAWTGLRRMRDALEQYRYSLTVNGEAHPTTTEARNKLQYGLVNIGKEYNETLRALVELAAVRAVVSDYVRQAMQHSAEVTGKRNVQHAVELHHRMNGTFVDWNTRMTDFVMHITSGDTKQVLNEMPAEEDDRAEGSEECGCPVCSGPAPSGMAHGTNDDGVEAILRAFFGPGAQIRRI
jgi:formate dehydrogenase maturation protein FdhE